MTWDAYFLGLCEAVAANSKCLSRKIGCVIADPEDHTILATGYNGPPRGVPSCAEGGMLDNPNATYIDQTVCPRRRKGYRSGEGLEYCPAGHAERNAIVNAARHGVRLKGATLYLNVPVPCGDCLIEIINAGIVEVVCTDIDKRKYYDRKTGYLLEHSDLKLRRFNE